jgi:transmembrane 9 superfamily protein 2/4
MPRMCAVALALVIVLCVQGADMVSGFYLPGLSPRSFERGEPVHSEVIKLDSIRSPVDFEYYHLPFCTPGAEAEQQGIRMTRAEKKLKIKQMEQNLGEMLEGEEKQQSPYDISMLMSEQCKLLCRQRYNKAELEMFQEKIKEQYRVQMLLDDLPVATRRIVNRASGTSDGMEEDFMLTTGYPIGVERAVGGSSMMYLYNHIHFIVDYYMVDTGLYRIVGAEVVPHSVQHRWKDRLSSCSLISNSKQASFVSPQLLTPENEDGSAPDSREIIWTYGVEFRLVQDLKNTEEHKHWFKIMNSVMMVMFLAGLVAVIMIRTLRGDLSGYNEDDGSAPDLIIEEKGWKLIRHDVFRPPRYGGLFSVVIGTGVQLLVMSVAAISLAALGFLSPANRGSLSTTIITLFTTMSVLAGYYSTQTYKLFGGTDWRKNALYTAVFFPGTVSTLVLMLNALSIHEESSDAIPFKAILALVAMWVFISIPLMFLGAWLSWRRKSVSLPGTMKPSLIHRLLRTGSPWYVTSNGAVILAGMVPFLVLLGEFYFVMTVRMCLCFCLVFSCIFYHTPLIHTHALTHMHSHTRSPSGITSTTTCSGACSSRTSWC